MELRKKTLKDRVVGEKVIEGATQECVRSRGPCNLSEDARISAQGLILYQLS